MTGTLERLRAAQVLEDIDVHFARTVARLAADDHPALRLGAALASEQRGNGNVCVDLRRWASQPIRGAESEAAPLDGQRWPELEAWLTALRASRAVDGADAPGPSATPLVLDSQGRLYLRRLWQDQQQLALGLLARGSAPLPAVDGALLREGLDRLFGAESRDPDHPAHGQRRAVLIALLRPLCVITGGPGTGKTTTVVRLLALAAELALAAGRAAPAVHLLAPTGKAAARMVEAIRHESAGLALSPGVREALPGEASTIHRALRPVRGSTTRFRHHAGNPLPADLVLVDEASMVDLSLMARLLDALPPDAGLVLLGDRDQLTSVEAGAILGDLCGPEAARRPRYSGPLVEAVAALTGDRLPATEPTDRPLPLQDAIAPLRHSFRFRRVSGIGALAAAIRDGDADAALAVLRDPQHADVTLREPIPPPTGTSPLEASQAELLDLAQRGYTAFFESISERAETRLGALDRYRVLCAHRRGPLGAEALNQALERRLREGSAPRRSEGPWYDGRPILITENDYGLGLFNGDVGLISREEAEDDARAHFVNADGSLRAVATARLPAHETVYAMSVHKSQGSEFDEVLVVLPHVPSRVLTRELLYTAVTRARQRVTVVASADLLRHAVVHHVSRASGLRDLLA